MKETTFKCDVCKCVVNGGGFSYQVDTSKSNPGADPSCKRVFISKVLSEFPSHACGVEHFHRAIAEVLQTME